MASYIYEMCCEPVAVQNRVSDWDMQDYSEIEDFQCTTDYRSARRGQSQIMW